MRILIIEDDARLARVMARMLEQEHFQVDVSHDGISGLEMALGGLYDGLIVDWMLPGQDGLQIIRALHAAAIDTPALLLTARGEVPQRVEGLNAGADDYLSKPFAFEELLARLHALLRRGQRPLLEAAMTIGDLTIDIAGHTVTRNGVEISLSPTEFAVLELLARNRGQVMTRDQLLERVWGADADPQGNVVELYIHYLRRKLATSATSEPIIRTVRGSGYVISGT